MRYTKKALRSLIAVAIVCSLLLAGGGSALALDDSYLLKYEDIGDLIKKHNPDLKILERNLDLLVEQRSDLADLEKENKKAVSNIRTLRNGFAQSAAESTSAAAAIKAEIAALFETLQGLDDPAQIAAIEAQIQALQGQQAILEANAASSSLMQGSLLMNQAALEDVNYDSVDMAITQMKIGVEQTAATLTNAAQNIFLTYKQLQDRASAMEGQRTLLVEQLRLAQVQLQYGLGTKLAVSEAEMNLTDFDAGYTLLNTQAEQLLRQLKQMVGWEINGLIMLGPLPAPNRQSIEKVVLAEGVEEAQKNSFAIRNAEAQIKYTDDDDQNNLTRLEIQKTKDELALAVRNQYQSIVDKNNALSVEEQRLPLLEEKLKQTRLQCELGLLPAISLKSEEYNYETQKQAIVTARQNLFWEQEIYKALLAGLSLGTSSSAQSSSIGQ